MLCRAVLLHKLKPPGLAHINLSGSLHYSTQGDLPRPVCKTIYAHQLSYGMRPLSCLSCVVQKSLLQIVAASSFAIVAAALECHVNEASRRGWALPTQLLKGTIACLPVCPPVPACCSVCLPACLPACHGSLTCATSWSCSRLMASSYWYRGSEAEHAGAGHVALLA